LSHSDKGAERKSEREKKGGERAKRVREEKKTGITPKGKGAKKDWNSWLSALCFLKKEYAAWKS
jgi:hypothetical protein